MQDTELKDITLAVLAGGAGTRMGGPKGSLTIAGRPIMEYLLDRFAWPGPTMLVLAPGLDRPIGAERFTQVTYDPITGLGPLRGILTALENVATSHVIVATVDMPGINHEHLKWIARAAAACESAMCLRESNIIEPFPSLFRSSARSAIEGQIANNRRSVQGLLKLPGFVALATPADWPLGTWSNLNTPGDLRTFQGKM
jgi:molybdopterin-guanine dinucleotide biosynthesis protein A